MPTEHSDLGMVVVDCGFGYFNCTAGGCIDISVVCDGSYNCREDGDHSDEEGCRTFYELYYKSRQHCLFYVTFH